MHVTLKLSWVIITTEKARDWPAHALYLLTSIEWLVFLEKTGCYKNCVISYKVPNFRLRVKE